GWLGGFVELHSHAGRAARSPAERPLASPLARLQAGAGRRVSSLRHRVVELEEPDRRLLCLLDGTGTAPLVENLPDLAPEPLLDVRLRGFAEAALLFASLDVIRRDRSPPPRAGKQTRTDASGLDVIRRYHTR